MPSLMNNEKNTGGRWSMPGASRFKLLLGTEAILRLRQAPVIKRKAIGDLLRELASGTWEDWQGATRGFSSWVSDDTPNKLYTFTIPDFGTFVWQRQWSVDLSSVVRSPRAERESHAKGPHSYAPFVIIWRVLADEQIGSVFDFRGRAFKSDSPSDSDGFWERKPADEVEYGEELFHLSPNLIDDFLSGVQLGLPLHLSEDQARVLSPREGPILLSGQAGCGKTSVIISWLLINHLDYLDQSPPPKEPLSQLFVTFSNRLRDLASFDFRTTLPKESGYHKTQFKSFRELLLDLIVGKQSEFQSEREMTFERFMRDYAPKLEGSIDPILLWDEIRSVIKGRALGKERFLSLAEYSMLNDARGHCKVPKYLRPTYHERAKNYDDYLHANGYWDGVDLAKTCLESLSSSDHAEGHASGRYDKIACDEVQDMAMVEILLLLRLLRTENFADLFFTGDTAQVINPSGFLWERLKEEVYEESDHSAKPDVNYLEKNYRSCEEIIRLVNGVLEVRRALLDDEVSRETIESVVPSKIKPMVVLSSPLEILKLAATNPNRRLVLTKTKEEKSRLEELLAESKIHVTVLTIEESKGLEYEGVLLWKFFVPRHQEIAKEEWRSVFIPKKRDHLREEIKKEETIPYGLTYEFNLLHVGLTRARGILAFYDEDELMRIENLDKRWVGPENGLLTAINPKEFEKLWKTGPVNGSELFELGEKLEGRDTPQAERMFLLAADQFMWEREYVRAAESYARAKDYFRAAQSYAKGEDRPNQLRMLALNEEKKERWKEAGEKWDEVGDVLFKQGELKEAAESYYNANVRYGLGEIYESAARSLSKAAKSLSTIDRAGSAKAFQECADRWAQTGGPGLEHGIDALQDAVFQGQQVERDEDLVSPGRSKKEWIAKRYMEIYEYESSLKRHHEAGVAAEKARGLWRDLMAVPKFSVHKGEYEDEYREAFARMIESRIKGGETKGMVGQQELLLPAFKGDYEAAIDLWRNQFCAEYLRRGQTDEFKQTTVQLVDYLVGRGKFIDALTQLDLSLAGNLPQAMILELLRRRVEVAKAKPDHEEAGMSYAELARRYGIIHDIEKEFESHYNGGHAYLMADMLTEAALHFDRAYAIIKQTLLNASLTSTEFNTPGKYAFKVANEYMGTNLIKEAIHWGNEACGYFAQDFDVSLTTLRKEWEGCDNQIKGQAQPPPKSSLRTRGLLEFVLARLQLEQYKATKKRSLLDDVDKWAARASATFGLAESGDPYSGALADLNLKWS